MCLFIVTCSKKPTGDGVRQDILAPVAEGIAKAFAGALVEPVRVMGDLLRALHITGLWTLEKTQDINGDLETFHDSHYVAFMSDGHVITVDGDQRQEVSEENMQEIMKIAGYYNSTGDYENEYRIRDNKIFIYDTKEIHKGDEGKPEDILNIISLENSELVVFSENEKKTLTLKQIFSESQLINEHLEHDVKLKGEWVLISYHTNLYSDEGVKEEYSKNEENEITLSFSDENECTISIVSPTKEDLFKHVFYFIKASLVSTENHIELTLPYIIYSNGKMMIESSKLNYELTDDNTLVITREVPDWRDKTSVIKNQYHLKKKTI